MEQSIWRGHDASFNASRDFLIAILVPVENNSATADESIENGGVNPE
jgi:hypothetical protein